MSRSSRYRPQTRRRRAYLPLRGSTRRYHARLFAIVNRTILPGLAKVCVEALRERSVLLDKADWLP